MPIRGENLCGETHFAQGAVNQFQVGQVVDILTDFKCCEYHFLDKIGMMDAASLVNQLADHPLNWLVFSGKT